MLNKLFKKLTTSFKPEENYKSRIFSYILLFELFSFAAFLIPGFRNPAFIIISLIAAAVALSRLDMAILILLAELFIGSKGYLFYFEYGGIILPMRIVLWLIIISVWLSRFIIKACKEKKLNSEFFYQPFSAYYFILFAFITWGLINGLFTGHNFGDIFFDFNGWLFFALIFPLYSELRNKEFFSRLNDVFWASLGWLTAKTFIILFIFSHNISIAPDVYRWIRTTGVGEITKMEGGFYRIFFQSHIFLLIGFFLLLIYFASEIKNKKFLNKKNYYYFLFFSFVISGTLISLSRSFWAGIIVGLALFFAYLFWKKFSFKNIIFSLILMLVGVIISFLFIIITVKFPYPSPEGGVDTGETLAKRISEIRGESAASSRWSLLPPLWTEIRKHSILGNGFGATVTYQSSDPRVLQSSPDGEYTTFAFEWAWLDIWLKLGIFGLIAYIILLGKITIESIKKSDKVLMAGLTIGLIAIITTNIFTPYLNHPLGIGCVMLISLLALKKD